MDIIISNSAGVPIYEQITQQMKGLILRGELREGEALPSMRLLAGVTLPELADALTILYGDD